MKDKKVLIIGNKPYHNFDFTDIHDSFNEIYRFNFAWPGNNNGTKFGRLAMCQHVYSNLVGNPVSRERIIEIYGRELNATYLNGWYDFFQENKESFDEMYHQNEYNWGEWNKMLDEYGSSYRFSKMASTGYSTIFRNLVDGNNKIFVSGFTLFDDEIRETVGETDEIVKAKNQGRGSHSFLDERNILTWLHNNKKIDASLCMLDDTEEISINTNDGNIEPSEFILDLIKEK